ncbi:MAG: prepilin-type N-terminal cleavage/methylation domain-containing protein [Candidatus Omnitrophota bacterium]
MRIFSCANSFTMMEIMITLVIIGVLAVLGFSQYESINEKVKGQDAINSLQLVYTAERIYRGENPTYGTCLNTADCNTLLNLELSSMEWNYSVAGAADSFVSTATRSGGQAAYNAKTIVMTYDPSVSPDPSWSGTWPFL